MPFFKNATENFLQSNILDRILKSGATAPGFTLAPELREVYLTFGIDLERFNGNDSWKLALPGRVIINKEGVIHDSDVHPD